MFVRVFRVKLVFIVLLIKVKVVQFSVFLIPSYYHNTMIAFIFQFIFFLSSLHSNVTCITKILNSFLE